ncbi:MAG: leucine-rich repeat domain-containing protein, partial [Planctomycetota bacterium]
MRNSSHVIRVVFSVVILLDAAQSGRTQESVESIRPTRPSSRLGVPSEQSTVPRLRVFWRDSSVGDFVNHEAQFVRANAVADICSRLNSSDSRVRVAIWMESLEGNTLRSLASLKQLESLSIVGSSFRAGHLKELSQCPTLKHLSLDACRISDDDCRELASFPALEVLQLSGAGVSDAGMKYLSRIRTLTELDLRGTQVSDAGLVPLKNCRTLRLLDLRGTVVTAAGANRLN